MNEQDKEIDPKIDAKLLKRIKDDPEWALRSLRRMIRSLEQYDKRIKRYEAKEIAELERRHP